MEKRNVVEKDRTPLIEKQANLDEMEKEAVDKFKQAEPRSADKKNKK